MNTPFIERNKDVTFLNGLQLPSTAHSYARIQTTTDLEKALHSARAENIPVLAMGSGTNTIWGKEKIEKMILHIDIKGFDIIREDSETIDIKFGAGELWDECVSRCVNAGYAGIEALSAIPGTAGAAPVQNIGAYGTDVSRVLISLEVFNTETGTVKIQLNKDLKFGYRDSIFKHKAKGKFIITTITLRLSKQTPTIPHYKDVEAYFAEHRDGPPSLRQIRTAIQKIRSKKLPDPNIIPNCGSFFKNCIVEENAANHLLERFPEMPTYPDLKGIKIPSGWLIERSGLKGSEFGPIIISKDNALVLTAPHKNATIDDLIFAKDAITKKIQHMFDLELEMEPEILF